MPLLDLAALVFFFVCWLFYEPLLKASFRGGMINTDMAVVRAGWMRAMTHAPKAASWTASCSATRSTRPPSSPPPICC